MAGDALLDLIETIHDAAVEGDLWPRVLAGTAALIGGIGATLEIVSRGDFRYDTFYSHGVPRADETAYVEHYAALNPRVAAALRQRPGEAAWDYQLFDESGMDRDPFYAEFLPRMDMRYAVAGILDVGADDFGAVAVQRTARQGHVNQAEVALMKRVAKHVSQAIGLNRRLRQADALRRSFEQTLEWLADGVVVLDGDGKTVYTNQAFGAFAAAQDGVTVRKRVLEFAAGQSRARFAEAFALIGRYHAGDVAAGGSDFAVLRRSGAPAYLLSLRPLSRRRTSGASLHQAAAILLLRDPLKRHGASLQIFREVLDLSEAEAGLAQALQLGVSPNEYARMHALSANTIYTHLKRIKEKSGCHRMSALIRRLNDLQMLPLLEQAGGSESTNP